jgi:hypothetical protein
VTRGRRLSGPSLDIYVIVCYVVSIEIREHGPKAKRTKKIGAIGYTEQYNIIMQVWTFFDELQRRKKSKHSPKNSS